MPGLGVLAVLLLFAACRHAGHEPDAYTSWRVYGGDPGSNSYSALDQINTENVDDLEVAWIYHSGDKDSVMWKKSISECNPIIIDGTMYLTSPALKVIALDAATGQEIWRFDPFEGDKAVGVNRGVAYWEDGGEARIFFSAESYLYSLDAHSGAVDTSFGESGRIDLREGLDREPEELYVVSSSPGVVFEDLLIMGSSLGEGNGAAPGHIRAYDVRTGRIEWIFRTIPYPDEFGYDTWGEDAWRTLGGTNAWAGMSLDPDRGVVFLPLGAPSPQLIGTGERRGANLFGNAVVAVDAASGERIWHYQTIHHDIWDWDLPAPPNLVTVTHDGAPRDAVAQVTKQGFVFLLDRETGEPLFPIEERPVPASTIPEDETWPTQPFPTKPDPYTRQHITEEDLTDISPEARAGALERFRELHYEGLFTPIGLQETLFYPSTLGGANWGGASFDPETGVLYVNANDFGYIFSLKKLKSAPAETVAEMGERLFSIHCTQCHGAASDDEAAAIPSLADVEERLSPPDVEEVIETGRGRMPGFPQLSDSEKDAIVSFLFGRGEDVAADPHESASQRTNRYGVDTAYEPFADEEGYPATKPPWGTLSAINLNTGDMEWQVPLGEFEELTERGVPQTGTPNLGGSIVTAGGLVFIGATKDEKFRAFDKRTGQVLWEYELPAAGYAIPSTYEIDGKQYVVIAATGGGNMRTDTGDAFIAFALPQ